MRRLPIIFTLSIVFQFAFTQHYTSVLNLDNLERIVLPTLDNAALIEAEKKRRLAGEVHEFAKSHKTHITPKTHGNWEFMPEGKAIWRIRIYSKAAKSLNFGFTQYEMPKGGKLTLYSIDNKDIKGPFTAEDNESHHQLWTPMIIGEETIIEVSVPINEKENLGLTLAYVSHDFLGFGNLLSQRCHIDVVCDEEDGWDLLNDYRDIIQSVGLYFIGGVRICTGFLVNNARQDCRPYFMTANHCGVNAGNAPSVVVYWNYENQTCRPVNTVENGGQGNGSLEDFNTGSTLRSRYAISDMMLLELDDPVSKTANAFFAGWNNSPIAPDTTICIHHPNTEEKRISFSNVPTYTGTWARDDQEIENGDHLIVPNWSIGSTEGGSSGAPLFNLDKEVVGQLHGGEAGCGNNAYDSYGFFHTSWEGGGTKSSNLKSWLDPDGLNLMQIGGFEQSNCGRNILPDAYKKSVCVGDTLNYQLLFSGTLFDASELIIEGLLDSIQFRLSSDTIGSGIDTINLQLFDFKGLENTANTFKFIVQDSAIRSELLLQLIVLGSELVTPGIVAPENAAPAVSVNPLFVWESTVLSASFQFQLAKDTAFEDIQIDTIGVEQSSFIANALEAGTTYYWRVKTFNTCGESEWSAVSFFTTAVCRQYSSDNVPITINSGSPRNYTSKLTIPEQGGIADVNVIALRGTHTWISDLSFTLVSPEGTVVNLIDRPCFDESDFDIQFDDESALENIFCPITDGASYRPEEALSVFRGEFMQGEWTLQFRDHEAQDGGRLEAWGIEVCQVSEQFDISIAVSQDSFSICDEKTIDFNVTVGDAFDLENIRLEIEELPNGITRTIQPSTENPYQANVSLNNLSQLADGIYRIAVTAEDGIFSSKKVIVVEVTSVPNLTLIRPLNETVELIREELLFEWEVSNEIQNYHLELAIDSLFENIVYSVRTDLTFHTPTDTLQPNQTYFWRISTGNDCGNTVSENFKFTTETITNTRELKPIEYKIYPNPSSGLFFVETGKIEHNLFIYASNGQLLQQLQFKEKTTVNLSAYPVGMYWVKLINSKGMIVEKVVIE